MINQPQLDALADIFNNTEAHHKITIELEPPGGLKNTFRVTYEGCDEEWFKDLVEAAEVST